MCLQRVVCIDHLVKSHAMDHFICVTEFVLILIRAGLVAAFEKKVLVSFGQKDAFPSKCFVKFINNSTFELGNCLDFSVSFDQRLCFLAREMIRLSHIDLAIIWQQAYAVEVFICSLLLETLIRSSNILSFVLFCLE